jgi:hypothetical protein
MEKIDLGQIIGIAANLGVLAGILLLVYELNQNRVMMQAQTRSAITDTGINIQLAAVGSTAYQQVIAKVQEGADFDELSGEEREAFRAWWTAIFRHWENVNYQHRIGLYEDSEYFTQREAWRQILSRQDLSRDFWCSRLGVQSEAIYVEMDELLGEKRCR